MKEYIYFLISNLNKGLWIINIEADRLSVYILEDASPLYLCQI